MMGYAAGILPEAFDLVIASKLSMCDSSRADLASYEALGGAVLNETQGEAMAPDAFSKCLDCIDKSKVTPIKPSPNRSGVLPSPLQNILGGDLEKVKWKPLGRGVKQAIISTSGKASARLLYIPAGQAVPDHGHQGTELTLVIQGAFHDEVDRFGPGDLEVANEDLEHQPIAEEGEACICLAATDAPLRFNEFIPRLLQPLFKI